MIQHEATPVGFLLIKAKGESGQLLMRAEQVCDFKGKWNGTNCQVT